MLGLEDDSFPFKIIARTNEIPTWGKGKQKWLCKGYVSSQNSFSGRVKLCFKPPRHRHLYHLCHHHLRGRWDFVVCLVVFPHQKARSRDFLRIFPDFFFRNLTEIWWRCTISDGSIYGSCFLPSALWIFHHFGSAGCIGISLGPIASYGEGHRTLSSW